jgi:two-component system nitrate/nitrite response regulator NarL
MSIRIGLVDGQRMVVDALAAAVERVKGIELVARGETIQEARDLLERDDIDVILLAVHLVDGNGLQLLAEREPRERPRVLVVSSRNVNHYAASAAAKYGASGFVLKSISLPALLKAARMVAAGREFFSDEQFESPFVTLTTRERQILRLTMQGLSNKEIGAKVDLHRKTVEAHLSHMFEKCRILGGRIELSIRAAEEGWLDIQPLSRPAPN